MSQLQSAENLAKVVSQSEPSKLTPIEAAHRFLEVRQKMAEMGNDWSTKRLQLDFQTEYAALITEACALSGQFCEEWAKVAARFGTAPKKTSDETEAAITCPYDSQHLVFLWPNGRIVPHYGADGKPCPANLKLHSKR